MAIDPIIIRPRDLPAADTVASGDDLIVDSGASVRKAKPAQIVNAGAPVATQAEAAAGINNAKRMTPLRVKQAIDTIGQGFVDSANNAAERAETAAGETEVIRDTLLDDITAESTGVAPDQPATAEYDPATKRISFEIPQGETGDQGPPGPRGESGDQPYASRAAAEAAEIPPEISRISVTAPSGMTVAYRRHAQGTALITADGARWSPDGVVFAEHFGAVGDYSSTTDTGSDDRAAIQTAIDYLHAQRGGELHYRGNHLVGGPLHLREGVSIVGQGTTGGNRQVGAPTWPDAWPVAQGIFGAHSEGPVILIGDSNCGLRDCYVGATESRYNADISTGDRNTNCGVLIESVSGGAPLTRVECRNVLVRNQPADGFAIVGQVTTALLDQCVAVSCERHSYLVNSGTLTGRSQADMPGIIRILGCRGVNSGGHGLCVGDASTGPFAYRVQVENIECFRACRRPEHSYISAQHFLRGQDIVVRSSSGDGTSGFSGNEPVLDYSYAISGWNIRLEANRYIRYSLAPVNLFSIPGIGNRGIIIDGATASTAGSYPDYFLDITAASVDGLFVRAVRGIFNVSAINPAQLGDGHRGVVVDMGDGLGELRWNCPVTEMVAQAFSTRDLIIAQDSVGEIEFEGTYCFGVLEFTSNAGNGPYARIRFRVGGGAYCRLLDSSAATINVGTSPLDGTTGPEGAFNVAATAGNRLQFENRLGISPTIVLTLTSVNTANGRPVLS